MTPKTKEAVRQALNDCLAIIGSTMPEDIEDAIYRLDSCIPLVERAIALLDAESERPVGMRPAQKWFIEQTTGLIAYSSNPDDHVKFIERIQQDALASRSGISEPDQITKLAVQQEPLGKEFETVLHDNLWDLYERSEPVNTLNTSPEPVKEAGKMEHTGSIPKPSYECKNCGTKYYEVSPVFTELASVFGEEDAAPVDADAESCARLIMRDLNGRSGFDMDWLDDEVRREIKSAWMEIIQSHTTRKEADAEARGTERALDAFIFRAEFKRLDQGVGSDFREYNEAIRALLPNAGKPK